MEFDKSKILTVVTADQAKVGQKGWFSSNINNLAYLVREEQPKELLGVNAYNAVHAFRTSFQNHALFYPAPAPTYEERQAEWVAKNNVKVGTKVRFTKDFNKAEDGSYCDSHSWAKGNKGVVRAICDEFIYVEMEPFGIWACPFTALEVIKEPTYLPFNNAEQFKQYRDEWLTMKNIKDCAERFKVKCYGDTFVEVFNKYYSWEEAFNEIEFEDGTPFGIKEEA